MSGALELLGMTDIFLGVLSFCLQITYWAMGYSGIVVNAATGIWGGIVFIVTGAYALKKTPKTSIMTMAATSIGVGFFMIGMYSYGISDLVSYSFCKRFKPCNDALIITAIFLTAGIIAVLVNSVLLILAGKLPADRPVLRHTQQPNMQGHGMVNPSTTSAGNAPFVYYQPNGNGVVYQVAQPSAAYPSHHQQFPYQQNPPPVYISPTSK